MKKISKRKMYQKRRKKEKEEKRKNSQKPERQTTTASNCNYNKKYHQQSKHQLPQYPTNPALNSYTEGMRLWWQTYCTALQYHSEQRRQWKVSNVASEVQGIYSPTDMELLQKYAEEYDTSSSEEENEDGDVNDYKVNDGKHLEPEQEAGSVENLTLQMEEEVDREYLKFLEITHKHREELRLKREAETES